MHCDTFTVAFMSASKLDTSVQQQVSPTSPITRLTLPANTVRFRRNGIEFRSDSPLPQWTEMTVDLESPRDGKKLRCNGVVVACTGSRHSGYCLSMIFTGLSRQSQERLNSLAYS